MSTLVQLVPYNPDWAQQFSAAKQALEALLGPCVLAVDHIGSTAIPGMSAKPVIDIDVTVRNLADIQAASTALTSKGFEPRGNRYDDDVWAFYLKHSAPKLRVYLCPPKNRTHECRLLFRDYLRRNEEAATLYLALKTRLAGLHPCDGDRYTLEKRQFILEIVGKARETGC